MNYELNDVVAENQISLFSNILTVDQQNEVDEYIKRHNAVENQKLEDYKRLHALLNKYELNEFVEASYEIEESTYEKTFNHYSDNKKFTCEITTCSCKGGIKLIYKSFDSRKQSLYNNFNHIWISDVDFRNEKIQISNISDSYRYYKMSSVRKKINDINEAAYNQKSYSDKVISASDIVIADFKEKYPKAEITAYFADIKEYNQWVNRRVVKVLFESGSYVTYQVFTNANKSLLKVADNQKESIEQIMNRFNLQEKKS